MTRLHAEKLDATRTAPAIKVVVDGVTHGLDASGNVAGAYQVKTIGPAGVTGPIAHCTTFDAAADKANRRVFVLRRERGQL